MSDKKDGRPQKGAVDKNDEKNVPKIKVIKCTDKTLNRIRRKEKI